MHFVTNLNLQRSLTLGLVLVLVALPAAADKVWVDYDRSVDFSGFSTFTYERSGLALSNDLMDQRIVDEIVKRLKASGLKQVESSGDIVVTYQVMGEPLPYAKKSKSKPNVHVQVWGTGGGWGYGVGWSGGWAYDQGGWKDTSVVKTNFKKGSLLIEAYDSKTHQAIWRGSAEQAISDNPKKSSKNIEKSIHRIAEKWQELHEGGPP